MTFEPKNSSFFYTCKENFFSGINPANPESQEKDGYLAAVNIAKVYFSADLYEPLIQYLHEGRYLIDLWSAYLILQYGEPDISIKISCIQKIENVLNSPEHALSQQQQEFLKTFLSTKI